MNYFTPLEYEPIKLLSKHDKIDSIFNVRDGEKIYDQLWPNKRGTSFNKSM